MSSIYFTALTVWCIAASCADLRTLRLPNALTGSGAAVILGFALCTGRFTIALCGAALLASPYLLVHLAAPAALGAGDAKLAVGLGAAAALGGAQCWVSAALAAPVLTALAAVVQLVHRAARAGLRADRAVLPHGPSMCLATLLALAVWAPGAH
ncbi:prepilin peptidase [Nocardia beijingensis]|uniref:prepilin peptidase n=1 Tax=Nocardia beijingensis TaxID=95162 RepID=UPI00332E22E4